MSMRRRPARPAGFTLIELVMAIVVVSAGVAGVLAVMSFTAARSADPLLAVQAHAVARAYLDEILLRAYADPDASEAGEDRATFDDVDDYHGLAANGCLATSAACPAAGDCACDQFGAPVDGLAGYRVGVAVTATALNGAPAKRVDVRVTHLRAPSVDLSLSGFRAAY